MTTFKSFVIALFLTTPLFAKDPLFTSEYLDIQKVCKSQDAKSPSSWRCPFFHDYEVTITSYPAEACLFVQRKDQITDKPPEKWLAIACDPYAVITQRKLEWRLADGKPFAVLLQKFSWDSMYAEEPQKIGLLLLVRGLLGFENINTFIDTKTQDYELARRRADEGYKLAIQPVPNTPTVCRSKNLDVQNYCRLIYDSQRYGRERKRGSGDLSLAKLRQDIEDDLEFESVIPESLTAALQDAIQVIKKHGVDSPEADKAGMRIFNIQDGIRKSSGRYGE